MGLLSRSRTFPVTFFCCAHPIDGIPSASSTSSVLSLRFDFPFSLFILLYCFLILIILSVLFHVLASLVLLVFIFTIIIVMLIFLYISQFAGLILRQHRILCRI